MTSTETATPEAGHNQSESATKKFFRTARELGGQHGLGEDALVKLAAAVAYAASDGAITLDKDTEGKDDAHRAYDAYVDGFSKKNLHEHAKKGKTANVSKLRAVMKASVRPSCDFVGGIDTLTRIRAVEEKAGNPVKGAYQAIVEAARAQQTQDDDLTDEQLREIVGKAASEDPTIEDRLNAAKKILEGLITGENKWGLKDQDPNTITACEAITSRLATMVVARETQEIKDKAQALGLTLVAA